MAKQVVNIGASANDGTGDPLRNAFDKINDNFNELYFALGGNTPTSLFDVNGNLDYPSKPNKISAYYATEVALLAVSASTYKGCIGFAQDTNYLYYSDGSAWVKLAKLSEVSGSVNAFSTISVSGQTDVVADTSSDTITFIAGSNVTLTTDAVNDTITIAAATGSNFSTTDVDNHLNTNTADINEILAWTGSDYAWVAQPSGGGGASAINDLSDVTISSPANGQVLKYNGSAWVNAADATSGTGTFVGLTDTPAALGSAGQVVRVNSGGTALEFANPSSGITTFVGLSDTPGALGSAGQVVRVNSGGSALEFASIASYANADVDTHLNTSTASSGDVLSWNGSDYAWSAPAGGASLARTTQGVATTIADGATENIQFSGLGKAYTLFKVTTTAASWIRIYSDTASRTADAGRTQGSDPAEGAGIIAEFIATGATTFKVTPGLIGWVDNSETVIPVAVTNLSGASASITTTLVGIPLET